MFKTASSPNPTRTNVERNDCPISRHLFEESELEHRAATHNVTKLLVQLVTGQQDTVFRAERGLVDDVCRSFEAGNQTSYATREERVKRPPRCPTVGAE